ncbi:hypothetical protein [Promicromonospora sp. NFX87]|uniref:hypothetical protein n=1 Tax=Promicromonospora sp. NFX87 TaxID=3402691 RepID=UPI003AFAB9E3
MQLVHCHVPVTVRLHGVPDDAALEALCETVGRAVRERLAQAERVVAERVVAAPAAGGDRAAGASSGDDVAEPWDDGRDLPEGYAIPSYDGKGRFIPVPVTGPPPGRAWRVLHSTNVRAATGEFFDWVEQVATRGQAEWGAALPQRALYEDLSLREHYVAVWVVEVLAPTTLSELTALVSARARELLGSRRGRTMLHAATFVEDHVSELAAFDTEGRIAQLPLLYRTNARRVVGSGPTTKLLRRARVVWAGMELPEITSGALFEAGPSGTVHVPLTEAGTDVDPVAFERRHGLTWQAMLDEAGGRAVRVDYLPLRARRSLTEIAADYAGRELLDAVALPPPAPGVVPAAFVAHGDAPVVPAAVRDAVAAWSAALPPLAPPAKGSARDSAKDRALLPASPRAAAGAIAVACRVHLPFDAETLGAARLRPVGRVWAEQLRALLRKDTEDREWKYLLNTWFGRLGAAPEARPDGGTAWEYTFGELAASGHLVALFDAVAYHKWWALTLPLLQHSRATSYANHPLVAALFAKATQHWLDTRANSYTASGPGVAASVAVDRDEDFRLTVGGSDVLGSFSSAFLHERTVNELKADAAARFKAAILAQRGTIVAQVAAGKAPGLSDDEFLRAVVAAACESAHLSEDDFEEVTVQSSLQLVDVAFTPQYGLPRWRVTLVRVERRGEDGPWTRVGETFTRSDDDFEASITYARLGKAGEFYQAFGLAIVIIGVVAVAWEAGIIAALLSAAGGAKIVLASIAISELIYIVRVLFFDAKLSLEGFLLAAVEGYLNALGFRAGGLLGARLGRSVTGVGAASVSRVWAGIVVEKLAVAVVGGTVSGALTQFAHDVVEIAVRDGTLSSWTTYVERMTVGAAFGLLAEFGLSPVLRALGSGGRTAVGAVDDLVTQLRAEGFTLAQLGAGTAEALASLRGAVTVFAGEAAVSGLLAAMTKQVAPVFSRFLAQTTARRVLELSGAKFSRQAVQGLELFLQAADDPASSEAARRLALTFAKSPQQAVHLMEVLAALEPAQAKHLLSGTFTTAEDLSAFLSRIAHYTPDQQRGVLALLAEAGLVARPPGGGSAAQAVIDTQFERALRLQAESARLHAVRLRRQAHELLDDAVVADRVGKKARADVLLDQAVAREAEAARALQLADDLAAGRTDLSRPAPPGTIPKDLPGDDPVALAAELDAALDALEAGTGGPVHAVWINLRARQLGPEHTKALSRVLFSSRSGNPVVFRIEGGTAGVGQRSKEFISVDALGNARVRTGGQKLNINVGSFDRAVEFLLEARPGARLKLFEIDATYLKNLRSVLTPEQGHPTWLADVDAAGKAVPGTAAPTPGRIADVQGAGRYVDTRQAADQLQLDGAIAAELNEFIVPGTGRTLEFTARTAGGKAVPR